MNNKKDKSKAKELAKKVIKVPQLVGRAVLAAPLALPRMIDKLEQDQCVADKLEFINQEIVEDQKRKEVVRISKVEGMKEIVNHLEEYLHKNPNGCYEDWVSNLIHRFKWNEWTVHSLNIILELSSLDWRVTS
jgi:GTPase Era involved in 16S rRNA processing